MSLSIFIDGGLSTVVQDRGLLRRLWLRWGAILQYVMLG